MQTFHPIQHESGTSVNAIRAFVAEPASSNACTAVPTSPAAVRKTGTISRARTAVRACSTAIVRRVYGTSSPPSARSGAQGQVGEPVHGPVPLRP